MTSCCLCNNTSSLFSYHRFPFNKTKKDIWLAAINLPNWKPGVYDRICSAHFEDKYLDKTAKDNRVRLRDDAVPSIFSIKKTTTKKNLKSQLSTKNKKKQEVQRDTSISQEDSKKKVTQIKQSRRIKIVDRTSLTLESVAKKQEQTNEKKENDEELTAKLKLAEFRINQYEMAVSHLQTRLEGMAAQYSQINNELKNAEAKYKEEMLCKDLKIKQLESENEQLRNFIIKKQTVKEERILGP